MGRWKKDQNWRKDLKKIPRSIGLPQAIIDSLEGVNASEIITELVEQNMHKISDGSLQDSIEYRRIRIADLVMTTIKQKEPEIVQSINNAISDDITKDEKKFTDFGDNINKRISSVESTTKRELESLKKDLKTMEKSRKLDKRDIRSIIKLEIGKIIKEIISSSIREFVPSVREVMDSYEVINEKEVSEKVEK